MSLFKNIVYTAIEQAKKSKFHYQMGAVLFRKHIVLSTGMNHAYTPVPWRTRKHVKAKFLKHPTSIHAEVDALIRNHRNLSGASLFVCRVGKSGRLLMARPCAHCKAYLLHYGIKDIYYTDSNGEILYERLAAVE